MIYFAMDGKWFGKSKGSWTAVSKTPYLKAIAFYPKGDCWFGGGLWKDNTHYWLNDGDLKARNVSSEVLRVDSMSLPAGRVSGECPGVYFNRLLRDGWKYFHTVEVSRAQSEALFQKPVSDNIVLQKRFFSGFTRAPGRGTYWEEHELLFRESRTVQEHADWEWADVWQGALLWASKGRLFRGAINESAELDETMIADLNDMAFEAIKAPYDE